MPARTIDPLATDLRVSVGRLMRRLRAHRNFSLAQATVLGHLDREGAQSIGALATTEHVRPQSMSQMLAELEGEGLVTRAPDATDGRRTLISITDEGREVMLRDRAEREGWLTDAITELSAEDQELLARAVGLLDRLARH